MRHAKARERVFGMGRKNEDGEVSCYGKGVREGDRKPAFFTISACAWSCSGVSICSILMEQSDLSAPQSLSRAALRSDRLFVLMSASSIAWTRSSRTVGCRNRWFVLTVIGGSGMALLAYSSPARLVYPCPHEMASTGGVRGGPAHLAMQDGKDKNALQGISG